jgi:hypothetical protein
MYETEFQSGLNISKVQIFFSILIFFQDRLQPGYLAVYNWILETHKD